MKKFILLTIIAVFAAAFAGCGASETNSNNARNANANRSNTNVSNANTNTSTTSKWDPTILKEEYEKSRAKREIDKNLDTFGDTLEESWLWFKVRSALTLADDLRETTITVNVTKDVVTLSGTVRDEAQKKKAGEVAKVDGVASVKNELKVAPKDSVTNTGSMTDSDKTPKPKN
jgi:hypothetical protein